ncbi:HNH endonuclease [Williamsia phyllosphaerae]|uniref:HNH nuclease domain-containing protein n=1 Tax=Williamsia phyllosphaerae TaxID=885042 RepID=A0ABQ1UC78_9NOCA|nr:HNH endonuclease [Williamsia phyllosphaerae]GGF13090.1 hypothetical protein GCM10007298_06290 [Williamsia phyllosphaerae]
MALKDLTASAVESALAEYDDLGGKAFREKYAVAESSYLISRGSKTYDSKAIAAAAHGYLPGHSPLLASEFRGGENATVRKLRSLGFVIPNDRLDWTRDEVVLACDLLMQNDWKALYKNDPRVIELSATLQKLPFYPPEVRGDKFRNANGVARKTDNIASHHPSHTGPPSNGGKYDGPVLADFLADPERMHTIALKLRETLESNEVDELSFPVDDEDDGAVEGRLLQRRHFVYERDPKLRRGKIADFLNSHERVHCEVCGFDFEALYGERGRDYIEVHHVLPLHVARERRNRFKDLILLCANCHRMIHRGSPWLTPDQLREKMAAAR